MNPKGLLATLHNLNWKPLGILEAPEYTHFFKACFYLSLLDSPLCQLIWLKYHLTCIYFIDMADMTCCDVIQQNDEDAVNSWICWCVGTQEPLALPDVPDFSNSVSLSMHDF